MNIAAILEEAEQMIERWATLCAPLLAEDPTNYPKLKRALDQTIDWADEVYPRFEEGETVRCDPSLIQEPLMNEALKGQFIDLTGDLLFSGFDGPRVMGSILQRTLETLMSEIARGYESRSWRRTDGGE